MSVALSKPLPWSRVLTRKKESGLVRRKKESGLVRECIVCLVTSFDEKGGELG